MYNIKEHLIMFNEVEIKNIVKNIARQINDDYTNCDEILFIGILKGSVIFMSDLARYIDKNIIFEFIQLSSYGSNLTISKEVKCIQDLQIDIKNKHVIIIEDIIDTGKTIHKLSLLLQDKAPKSLKICTLLNKVSQRTVDLNLTINYVGIDIENYFVFGYGLDYAEKGRNLPYIAYIPDMI